MFYPNQKRQRWCRTRKICHEYTLCNNTATEDVQILTHVDAQ